MRNSFRQGLIAYPKDGTGAPQFLLPAQNPSFVSLNVSPTSPLLITFAHGSSDYLRAFEAAVPNAWGPMLEGIDNYLYWDIDLLTSQGSFGISALEPIVSPTEPAQTNDQHWFDLNTNKMKVWSTVSNKWLEKIRLFAGVVENGNTGQLVSKVSGSQVGLNAPARPGFIVLDSLLQPIRTSVGEFLTTDASVHIKTTNSTSGVLAKPLNAFIPIRAGENIPSMSVVYFSSEDTVSLASSDPALINQKTPIGIVQDDLATNEVGVLTQTGDIMWDQWDWSASIGKPLYVNSVGQLTPTRPHGLLAYRVGFVKNRNTIIFNVDAETTPQVYSASASDIIIAGETPITTDTVTNNIGERVATISIPAATALAPGHMTTTQASIVNTVPGRLDAIDADLAGLHVSKSDVGHTHPLGSLSDVDVTTEVPAPGDLLVWGGTKWQPGAASAQSLAIDDLTDVDTVNFLPSNGEVLTWNGSLWTPAALPSFQLALDDLTDVEMSYAPNFGDILTWNGSWWEAQALPVQAVTLNSLVDVTVTEPITENDVLSYVSGEWQPRHLTTNIKPAPVSTSPIAGNILFGSAAHHNAHLRSTAGSNVQITVQPDSYWSGTQEYWANDYNPTNPGPMPVGGSAVIGKHAAGDITFVAAAGVTINTPDTLTLTKLHGKVTLIKVAANVWDLEGNLATE